MQNGFNVRFKQKIAAMKSCPGVTRFVAMLPSPSRMSNLVDIPVLMLSTANAN
jgi:hypothetical protein